MIKLEVLESMKSMKNFTFQQIKRVLFLGMFFIFGLGFSFARNCNTPLTFRIVNVDSRFGITKEEVASSSELAAKIWNDSASSTILKYDNNGKVKISLVYDYRQKLLIDRNKIKKDIESATTEIDNSYKVFDLEKKSYEDNVQTFDKDKKDYEDKIAVYNQKVLDINNRGGTTMEEKSVLDQEKKTLDDLRFAIDMRVVGLNASSTYLKQEADKYNFKSRALNEKIKDYNKKASKTFEQGYYSNNKIVIFEYDDIDNLTKALAHELGHALGLMHTRSTSSLMYFKNSSTSTEVTAADIKELNRVCKF